MLYTIKDGEYKETPDLSGVSTIIIALISDPGFKSFGLVVRIGRDILSWITQKVM